MTVRLTRSPFIDRGFYCQVTAHLRSRTGNLQAVSDYLEMSTKTRGARLAPQSKIQLPGGCLKWNPLDQSVSLIWLLSQLSSLKDIFIQTVKVKTKRGTQTQTKAWCGWASLKHEHSILFSFVFDCCIHQLCCVYRMKACVFKQFWVDVEVTQASVGLLCWV